MKKILLGLVLILIGNNIFAQTMGTINGVVKDKNTQEVLIGVVLKFVGKDTVNTLSDVNGNFSVQLPVGKYNLETSYIGYTPFTLYNINLSSGNAQILQIELDEKNQELQEVVINAGKSVRATDMITPLATQKLTAEEIKSNPGGNFDVSKVIQVLPGVAGGTTPNRNDIIVRGGGPSENVYYLDGIEIPVLNHFQTQGASGGATGILNVSFIQDVQLTSSAFNAKYDNALASTIVIKQRNGNPDKLSGNFRLSGTEFAAMLEGPLGKKTTFMASARRSYLQFLFKLLDLPIRPDYYDFQYKINHKINNKTELTFIGIGAIDNFKLAVPKKSDANTEYINRANPLINQWNYTVGATLKRLVNNGFFTIALSRNMFFNGADRYENNASKSGNKLFSLGSHETENKLRFDMNKFKNGWKYSYDGDGKDEILGIDTKGWITMFSFSNNSWNWKWSDYGNHSISSYKDNMVSGDFDGDGKDEILGFNMNGWTTMFNFENNNFQWGWSDYGNNHSIRSYRENLIVGDFNGDGKDEILGNDIDNGWLTLFRFENGDFKWKWSNYGSNHMMLPYRNNLIVGNFDSDPADEILGIDTWATKFDFDNNNWSWNWSSEESSLLGDWIVNKNNNFLFLKADPSEPEYFMVLSQNTNHDFCNMYLKNPLPEANATYKMNKIFGTKETKKYISDNTNLSNDWVIYPNPSEGLFKISFNKREPDSQIKIYNQTGKLIKTIDNTQARELEIDLSNYPAGLYIVALKGTNSIQMKKIIKIK